MDLVSRGKSSMNNIIIWTNKLLYLVVIIQINYCQASSKCGTTFMPASSGYLSSPRKTAEYGSGGFSSTSVSYGYGMDGSKYPSNTECTYDIKSPSGTGIKFVWKNVDIQGDMPDCKTDYVEVFLTCNRYSIGRFCSGNILGRTGTPFDMYSSDNCLRIKFHSGTTSKYGNHGFWGQFTSFSMSQKLSSTDQCKTSSYGLQKSYYDDVYTSPNWPQYYPVRSSGSCYYKIALGDYNHAKLVFMDFHLFPSDDCEDTKIKIKVGKGSSYDSASNTLMESKCGVKKPFTLIAKGDNVIIRFKAETNSQYRGFLLGYVKYTPASSKNSSEGGMSGTVIAIVILMVIMVIVVVVIFIVRRARVQRMQQAAVVYQATPQQAPPPVQTHAPPHSYPPPGQPYTASQQPPPGQGYAPPPSYDQVAGQQYPGTAPYPQKQDTYQPPATQPYPPPASGPPYPPPGGQPYPPPASQPYPPPAGQSQPNPAGYPPSGGTDGPSPPYPT